MDTTVKVRFPTQEESPGIIKGLTADESKDGLQIMSWDYGHLKFKIKDDHIEWTTIYVEPRYRDQQCGLKILEWVKEEAKKMGKSYVLVSANTDGESDILGRFLTRAEYKSIGYPWFKKYV